MLSVLFARPSYVCLIIASLLFALSLTPSMIPRPFVLQGLLSGFALLSGYGFGVLAIAVWKYMELPGLKGKAGHYFHTATAILVACIVITSLYLYSMWQDELRIVLGLPEHRSERILSMALIALGFAASILLLARVFVYFYRQLANKLQRRIPHRIANVLSVTVLLVLVFFFSNTFIIGKLLNVLDHLYAASDALTDTGAERPGQQWQTGSDYSLIEWDTLGRTGQNFVSLGPQKENIAALFPAEESMHPLRVYVGLRSAATVEARAKLALDELKRTGGFARSKLVIATPTGTGWHDPSGVDPFEYLHRGDTAMVTMQYSYLPSWLTLLLDPTRSKVASRALFQEVYQYWTSLPKSSRPQLYIYGLSLGALGAETSFDFSSLLRDPIHGAVLAGTPFPSKFAPELMEQRQAGSPQWQPIIADSSFVRFTSQENATSIPGATWGKVRVVYIQYAADPMVFFSPDLYYKEPDWIKNERGPDISPSLRWYPVITFLQVLFDLPMADRVPKGVAHNYAASSYIDAWIAVSQPANWNKQKTTKLKSYFSGN
ncbi:Uncharacterized membrane protein [Alteromonadaceae bacterium Bs31]|nr:Uncharacterized membrane protein [Alteromonadaceae bacterium Bs31]